MIQPGSQLVVADNSGARVIECITVLGAARDRGTVGDRISASVKVASSHGEVKKKDVVRAVIVRQKQTMQRKDGSAIRFGENAAVIVNTEGDVIASRVFGPIPREIRDRGFTKIISLAEEIL